MPEYADSVFDSEIIHRDIKGKFCNNIYLFDAYVVQGEFVMNKTFNWNKETGRHIHLKKIEKYFSTGKNIVQENSKMPLLVYVKNYLPSDSPNTIKKIKMHPKYLKVVKNYYQK